MYELVLREWHYPNLNLGQVFWLFSVIRAKFELQMYSKNYLGQ